MACCKTPLTKDEFLREKAENFKNYIMNYSPNEEVLEFIDKFDSSNLFITITTTLLPLKMMGTSEIMISELINKLNIPLNEIEGVREKIGRYFNFFIEMTTS